MKASCACDGPGLSDTGQLCVRKLPTRSRGLTGARWSCQRQRPLCVLWVAFLQPVASPGGAGGTGSGGHDGRTLGGLAAGAPLILTENKEHVLAIRVPSSLLDSGTKGVWYMPCSGKDIPQPVVQLLQSLDEYNVPTGVPNMAAGPFIPKWCHSEWHIQLHLEREPMIAKHRFKNALHYKEFHTIPRTQRLPTFFDKGVVRFRSIPEATFPLSGYPVMGLAGSPHGLEVCLPPAACCLLPDTYLPTRLPPAACRLPPAACRLPPVSRFCLPPNAHHLLSLASGWHHWEQPWKGIAVSKG